MRHRLVAPMTFRPIARSSHRRDFFHYRARGARTLSPDVPLGRVAELMMATQRQRPTAGLIYLPNHGCQHAAEACCKWLASMEVQLSRNRVACNYDNIR